MYSKFSIVIIILLTTSLLFLSACRKDNDTEVMPSETPGQQIEEETPRELEEFMFTPDGFPRFDGSPSTAPLAQAITSVLLGAAKDDINNIMSFTRTTQAFRNLSAGSCDILIVGEPSPNVFNEFMELGFEVDMELIAMDALVFVVNSSNPVENLTTEQIRDIYKGYITNWLEVGGDDIEVMAFQRNEEASSQVLMQKHVMDWQPMANPPMQTFSVALDTGDNFAAISGFDGSAGAIGYSMLYYAGEMGMAEGLKIISVDGIYPEADTIKSGEYPFINPYYAVIGADEPRDGSAHILYNWLLSEAGQDLIGQAGYVPVKDTIMAGTIFAQELRWNVATNDSQLTPPVPPHSMHTRLATGQMPELIPSGTYGTLLPYSSAVTMNDGSLRLSKFGFVTGDGMIITDLIYDNIIRGEYYSLSSTNLRPAYQLQKFVLTHELISDIQTVSAVCALDGSWVTDFDYVNIVFFDEVIFLMRDRESFDIDVINYSGQLLYNLLELEWISDISEEIWAEVLVYGVSEGFVFVELNDETYALMDVLTGEIRRTDFVNALVFSEGLAAVVPDGEIDLWGFVNKELEIVIPPGYVYESAFINDRAIVETPDGSQHVINKQGEVIFSITSEYVIIQSDSKGFSVHSRTEWNFPRLYTSEFIEVEHPADAVLLGAESAIRYIGDGWYYCLAEEGTWLFAATEAYLIPQYRHFYDFVDGYIIYIYEFNDDYTSGSYGIMLPDGRDILSPVDVATLIPAINEENTVVAFIANTSSTDGYFVREEYNTATYMLISIDGSIIKTGSGILSYDKALNIFYVQGTAHSAWLDIHGNTLISIPSMAYSFD